MKQRKINEHNYIFIPLNDALQEKKLSSFGCFEIIGDSLIENMCLVVLVWIIG